MVAKAYPEEGPLIHWYCITPLLLGCHYTDEGNMQETGWIDINLPITDSEQEEPTDGEPMEEELSLNLEDAELEELPANEFDDEGNIRAYDL